MEPLAQGTVFAGHRIGGILGRGGMGIVYRAVDEVLDREVAMKLIAPGVAVDEAFRNRFKREARTAASIRHPNVVPIFHAGESEGVLYVTMQLIEGTDMRTSIGRHGRLEPAVAAELVRQTATALDAAHEQGLVHRDVKPANILVEDRDDAPHVYLTDFGLTKSVGSQSGLTQTGAVVGTLDFIAPEQLRGDPVDARADVYSLGCVLFNALTGRVPYPRDTDAGKLWAHVGEEPPSPCAAVREIPAGFDEVVRRAMAKAPKDRYPSAGDLGRAAAAAAAQRSLPEVEHTVARGAAAPGGEATRTIRGPRRLRRALAVAAAVASAAGLVGLGVALTGGEDGENGRAATNPAGAIVGEPIQITARADGETFDIDAAGGSVWVAFADARDRNALARIDARTRMLTKGFAAFPRPEREKDGLDLDVDGRFVWIAAARDHLIRIDTRSRTRATIPIPDLRNYRLAVEDEMAWVLSDRGELFGIAGKRARVTRRLGSVAREPELMDTGDGFVFVGQANGTIREVDTEAGGVIDFPLRIPKGSSVLGLDYEGGTLYAIGDDFKLRRADVRSGASGPAVRVPRFVGAILFEGTDAWMVEPVRRRLLRIDLLSGRTIGEPITLPRIPADMTADRRSVWFLNTDGSVTEVRH